jgi:hypothetical protein
MAAVSAPSLFLEGDGEPQFSALLGHEPAGYGVYQLLLCELRVALVKKVGALQDALEHALKLRSPRGGGDLDAHAVIVDQQPNSVSLGDERVRGLKGDVHGQIDRGAPHRSPEHARRCIEHDPDATPRVGLEDPTDQPPPSRCRGPSDVLERVSWLMVPKLAQIESEAGS